MLNVKDGEICLLSSSLCPAGLQLLVHVYSLVHLTSQNTLQLGLFAQLLNAALQICKLSALAHVGVLRQQCKPICSPANTSMIHLLMSNTLRFM